MSGQGGMRSDRCVLLLADGWYASRDGIHGVNRSLALSLSRYKGVSVYCALLCPLASVASHDKADAEKQDVRLIGIDEGQIEDVYPTFSLHPQSVFPGLARLLPHVTHIIGHVPITGEGAVKLAQALYRKSQVLLFYHLLPADVDWLHKFLPYKVPCDTDLVTLAEQADVVYSVTENIHRHFTAKFRNRATKEIDHRLFLPQATQEVFNAARASKEANGQAVIFTLCSGRPSQWQGLDIVACTVNKVAMALMEEPASTPIPKLIFGDVPAEAVEDLRTMVSSYITVANLEVEYHTYTNTADLLSDLENSTLGLLPSRAEPYGHLALSVLSSGLPCLVGSNCAVSMLIRRLTSQPENILIPVSPSVTAVRQDASVWRDRLLVMLTDMEVAQQQAAQLRTALRRDEATKLTHDNLICYCLGGIDLKHQVSSVAFKSGRDVELELPVLRALNGFISQTLRQVWRLKHHPLTHKDDLQDLLPDVTIPYDHLMTRVTNKIEEHDRRIVGMNDKNGAFIVYCPTPSSLSDLWAMCDVINSGLVETLLLGDCGDVLGHFRLTAAHVVSVISGPEFLAYKKELLRMARPKTAIS